MSKPFSFRRFIGKKGDSTINKGKAPDTVASTSRPGPRAESRDEQEINSEVVDVAPQEEPALEKYGLILLNEDAGQQAPEHTCDVVAVHGLGGGAYKTWIHDNGKLWLRDFLPVDLPGARIFTYGYNSALVFSRETGTLRDYARALLEDIRSERTLPEERARPLIFVCHSMGGIVVKQALIIARNESNLYPEFNTSVSGILFLGTPHQGSPSATYASILSQIANIFIIGTQTSRLMGPMRTELLHGLKTNEKELLHIAQDFRVHTSTLHLASFVEQKNMRGCNERIVDEKSGFMGAPTERLVPMPDCDHREICKLGEKNSNYKKLLGAITDSIHIPQPVVQSLQDIPILVNTMNAAQIGRSLQSAVNAPLRINVPQNNVSYFVIRQVLLKDINDCLVNPASRTVVLLGMGGSGKTQLALEFCRQAEESLGFVAVIWIDASSPVSVEQSYEVIARKFSNEQRNDTDRAATISFVQDTLRDWKERWLVVFDNYDDPKAFPNHNIRQYVPSGKNGHILFTSRHQDSARLGHRITVSTMNENESLNLLLQRLPMNEEEKIHGQKIAFLLGYLALALDQAGAYIRARSLPLKDFTTHYNRRKEVVLKEIPEEWEYRRVINDMETETALSIFTTWELSFEQISGSKEEKERKDHFLTLAAFFDHRAISERYFQIHFDRERPEWMKLFSTKNEWDGDKLGDLLSELQKLSLLQISVQQTSGLEFSLHPIVCDWIKLRKRPDTQQEFATELITALTSYTKDKDYKKLSPEMIQETVHHIDACVLHDKELLTKTLNKGLDSHPDSASWFASFYRDDGRYNGAEKLYERALAGTEEKLGPKHPNTLEIVQNLAVVYTDTGRYDEAEKLYERALAGIEKKLGPKHPDTLGTVQNLANVYKNTGRYDEAEKLFERSVARHRGEARPQAPGHVVDSAESGHHL